MPSKTLLLSLMLLFNLCVLYSQNRPSPYSQPPNTYISNYYAQGDNKINNLVSLDSNLIRFARALAKVDSKVDAIFTMILEDRKESKNGGKYLATLNSKVDTLIRQQKVRDDSEFIKFKYIIQSSLQLNSITGTEKIDGEYFYDMSKIGRNDSLVFQNDFGEGFLAPKYSNTNWGYVDKKGNMIIKYQYDLAGNFNSGLAPVEKNEQWYYIDETNKRVISFNKTITNCHNFYHGYALIEKKNDKAGGTTYQVLTKDERLKDIPNDLKLVWTNTKWHLFKTDKGFYAIYDWKGNFLYSFLDVLSISENIAIYGDYIKVHHRLQFMYGAYTLNKNVKLISLRYKYLSTFINGVAIAYDSTGKKNTLIDTLGHGIFPPSNYLIKRKTPSTYVIKKRHHILMFRYTSGKCWYHYKNGYIKGRRKTVPNSNTVINKHPNSLN